MSENFDISSLENEGKEKRVINELSFTPAADKRKVFPAFFTTLAVSGIIIILSATAEKYQGVISLLGALGLSLALYFYSRYIASRYTYSLIINTNGEPVFLVNKIAGKRSSLMFMSYIFDVISIEKFTKNGENKYTASKEAKKYDFTMTFGVKEFYVAKFNTSGISSEVLLEMTDELAKTLSEYVSIAKEEYMKKD